MSWIVTTVGIELCTGLRVAGQCTRSAPLRLAVHDEATSSPKAQMNRFSPLIREAITSPGNHDVASRMPSLLASATSSRPVSMVPSSRYSSRV